MSDRLLTPQQEICIFCKEKRVLERCHVIPKRFFCKKGINANLYDFEGENVVIMCPTHHKLYDNFCLSSKEKEIILPVLDSKVTHLKDVSYDWEDLPLRRKARLIKDFDRWFEKYKNLWK